MAQNPRHPIRRLHAFARDRRGVSAVEFSLILPVFIALYLGGVSLTETISVDRKVTATARTVADLVTKSDEVTSSELSSFGGLSSVVLAPAAAEGAVTTIVAVWTDENLKSTVDWSHRIPSAKAADTPAPAKGAAYTLPADVSTKSGQTIVTTVDYVFTPTFATLITGPIAMNETIYLKPRSGKCTRKTDGAAGTCGR